jgi:hypothetical protein
VINRRGRAGVAHRAQQRVERTPLPDRELGAAGAPRGDHRDGVVGLEARHRHGVGPHDPADLLVDGGLQLLTRDVAGDERRHASQRALLLGDARGRRPPWRARKRRALGVERGVIAVAPDDPSLRPPPELAEGALRTRAPARPVHDLGLDDDRVAALRDHAIVLDANAGKPAQHGGRVVEHGVQAVEPGAVHHHLDVRGEDLA